MNKLTKYTFIVLVCLFFQIENSYCQFTNFQNLTPGIHESSIVLGDIDSDGDLDLLITGEDTITSNNFKSYTNDGNGTYSFYADISPGVKWSAVVLGDIDSDGDLDIIMSGHDGSDYAFKIYKNDGNGNFSFYADIAPPLFDGSIALGDIDSDGDLDLIMTGHSGSFRFRSYKNDGNGNYSFYADISPAVYNTSIALGDIDLDGDLDLIMIGDSGVRNFKTYKNDGNGNYSFYADLSPAVRSGTISLGDIDSDGDPDLLMIGDDNSGGYHLRAYRNDGNGNFVLCHNISPGARYGCTSLGDIDSDGDLDFIMTGFDGNYYFKLFKNNGNGVFPVSANISPGNRYSSIALGDIDADGDLDLIMTGEDNVSTPHLKTYRNTNTINNDPPSIPTGMVSAGVSNNWRFSWNGSIDDHTSMSNIRYHIAIGTNSSGTYDYISTNIMFPRGQANLGSVPYSNFYQSKIPVSQECYWKVCSIDSAFQSSNFCAEQTVVSLGGKPENFSGELIATNKIRWRWDDNAAAETNYFIKNNSGIAISPLLGINATNWVQTNLPPNTGYTCYASAFYQFGGADSNPDSLWTPANPPNGLMLNAAGTNLILNWSAGPGGAEAYMVERSLDNITFSTLTTFASNLSVATYTDKELTPDTFYYYKVRSYNGDGIATISTAVESNYTKPSIPTGFTGTVLSTNQIYFRWNDNSTYETNYVVKDASGTAVSPLLGKDATNWTYSSLSPNTHHTCYAYVMNESGSSISSSTNLYTLTRPLSSFISTFTSVSRVGLSWNGNGGSWFEVDRAPGVSGNPGTFTNIAAGLTVSGYTDNALLNDTNYHYRISGFNGDGIRTVYITNEIRTKKGEFFIIEGGSNPANDVYIEPVPADICMIQIALVTGIYSDIKVTSIKFSSDGTGNEFNELTSVDLFNDIDKNGFKSVPDTLIKSGGYLSDDGDVIFSGLTNIIPAGTTNYWLLAYDIAPGADHNDTFRAAISNNTSVTCELAESGENIIPQVSSITGGVMTVIDLTGNTLSSISNIQITGNSGDIIVQFDLFDTEGGTITYNIEYNLPEIDNIWRQAAFTGTNSVVLIVSNSSIACTNIWNSAVDFKGNSMVRLRITPNDYEAGIPGISARFVINNVTLQAGEIRESDTIINLNKATEARVSIGSASPGIVDIRIYDILGDLVREITGYSVSPGVNQFLWDLKNTRGEKVSTGIYWIFIEGNGIKASRKWIIYR